jgi:transcription elongation GreA/GreB family factor
MSRAFVREQDIAAVEELPDRPISEHPNDVTPEGAKQIDAELAAARTAYVAAQTLDERAALASAARDFRYWSSRRASARIVHPPKDDDQVRFGATVKIRRDDGREQTFRIVGEDEADLGIDIACVAAGERDVRQACRRYRRGRHRRGRDPKHFLQQGIRRWLKTERYIGLIIVYGLRLPSTDARGG